MFLSTGQTQTNSSETPLICPVTYSGLLQLSLHSFPLQGWNEQSSNRNITRPSLSSSSVHHRSLISLEGRMKSKRLTRRKSLAVLLNQLVYSTHAHTGKINSAILYITPSLSCWQKKKRLYKWKHLDYFKNMENLNYCYELSWLV